MVISRKRMSLVQAGDALAQSAELSDAILPSAAPCEEPREQDVVAQSRSLIAKCKDMPPRICARLLIQKARGFLTIGMALATLSACSAMPTASSPAVNAPATPRDPRPSIKGLVIEGYNYTDLYIDSFEVNGHGGGNLAVSSPTAGGGGSTCCMSVYPALVPYTVTIKWKARTGKNRWCEAKAMVTGPIPAKPNYFEVHFMPDSKIEIAVTEDDSPPRLKLERYTHGRRHETDNVVHDEEVGRCQDGYF